MTSRIAPAKSLQTLAKRLSKNKGRTPVPPSPVVDFTQAIVRAVNGEVMNGDGTLNVTFDQLTIVSINMLNLFIPEDGMSVFVAVHGTQNYAVGPYNAPSTDSPQGQLGYAEITSSQTGITTLTDIAGLAVTVTVPAGRRIRIKGYCPAFQSGAGIASDLYGLFIAEGSTQLNGLSLVADMGGTVEAILTPSAGAHTYKIQGTHLFGSSAGIFGVGTGQQGFILVEDIGPDD